MTSACHHHYDHFVLRKAELLQYFCPIDGVGKSLSHRNARDLDVAFGHLARREFLHHGFVGGAEQVAIKVRPQAFCAVVGWNAGYGEGLPGNHLCGNRCVGGNDVCCQDGDGLALSNDFGEWREHEWRPCRTATPQQASRKGAMPGDVVEPVKGNGHVGGFVAVEFYVAVIEDVQHGDFGILRQGRMLAAKIFKSLSGCLCGAAMA